MTDLVRFIPLDAEGRITGSAASFAARVSVSTGVPKRRTVSRRAKKRDRDACGPWRTFHITMYRVPDRLIGLPCHIIRRSVTTAYRHRRRSG